MWVVIEMILPAFPGDVQKLATAPHDPPGGAAQETMAVSLVNVNSLNEVPSSQSSCEYTLPTGFWLNVQLAFNRVCFARQSEESQNTELINKKNYDLSTYHSHA